MLFPPEYEPHGVKMLYDGQPVDLSCEQEEVGCCHFWSCQILAMCEAACPLAHGLSIDIMSMA